MKLTAELAAVGQSEEEEERVTRVIKVKGNNEIGVHHIFKYSVKGNFWSYFV